MTVSPALVPTTAVPLDQEYDPPPVAVNDIEVVLQSRDVVVGAEIATVGGVVF